MSEPSPLLRGIVLTAALAGFAWIMPLGKAARALVQLGLSPSTAALSAQCIFLAVALIGAAIAFQKDAPRWLGLSPDLAHTRETAKALFVAIPSHVATTWIALAVALPSLSRDLERHGAGVARAHAAPIIRATTEAPWFITIVSSALVAAAFEEIVFRGLLWSVLERVVRQFRNLTHVSSTLVVLAPLVGCTCVFAWLHADTPGGVGVVRVVSASMLGLFCGLARGLSKSVMPAIAIHVINNLIAIGRARSWIGTDRSSLVFGVPPVLIACAIVCLLVLAVWHAKRCAAARTMRTHRDEDLT